jgi:hypothetical protein
VIIKSTLLESKRGSKDRGQNKEGRRIKRRLLGGSNVVSLLVLGVMRGLPGTSSQPAQMGIGVSYCEGVS